MTEISQFYNTFQSASAALEKLAGVLDEEPDVPEPTDPVPLATPRGELRFDDVDFATPTAGRCCPISTSPCPPGRRSPSSAPPGRQDDPGQARHPLLRPDRGRVLLDGVDLRDLSSDDLRGAVVMVTQENYLFTGTIADNIRFGRPDATRTRSSGRPARSARTTSSRRCHTATTPRWPTGWPAQRRASASSSRSRARSWPTPPCSSSTRRRRRSTSPRSGWCSRRCARCWPGGRR